MDGRTDGRMDNLGCAFRQTSTRLRSKTNKQTIWLVLYGYESQAKMLSLVSTWIWFKADNMDIFLF